MKGAWVTAALAVLGATLASGRAEGGSAITGGKTSGLTLKGGVTQGGDPQFTYYLNVYLTDDTIPAYTLGSSAAVVTATGLTGVSAGDMVSVGYQSTPEPNAIWSPVLGTESATISYYGYSAITATGSDPLLLFQLIIVTPPNTPSGLSPGDNFMFSYTIGSGNDQQTGQGIVTVTAGALATPEPSSLILLLVGGAVLPYFGIRERRRRHTRRVG
jgi:hypothetical protein